MSLWLAAFLASLIASVLAAVLMFAVALVAAPRKIASGPVVMLARVLFLAACACAIVALFALIGGLVTSWA